MDRSKPKRFGRWTLLLFSGGILLQTVDQGCRQQVESSLFTGVETFATSLVSAVFSATSGLITAAIQAFFLGLANRGGGSTTVEAIFQHVQQVLC
jgi:hypothetical protein